MRGQVGVWVDFKRALVVHFDDEGVHTQQIESDVESKHRSTGGAGASKPFWHRSVNSGSREDARRDNEIASYYGEIAKAVDGCNNILVCGPGEAKLGLKSFLEESRKPAPEVMCESTESHITDAQIVAHIRDKFGNGAPRTAFGHGTSR